MASAVALVVFVFTPHSELANFFKTLLRVATFILVLCMCCLSKVTPKYLVSSVVFRSTPFHDNFNYLFASISVDETL